ncbi:hypothetical protein TRFO_32282 [Tritrichomonas foetus]|uniref:Uncharacterized protein n=1 Tax=Tritrichomonas foetus TaxID=1144522 RepID=A0A1J4JUH8_9EUKA|nr:hypothetical protein TRFO_32282 [Tritrichomonas foetus]|eukprot:OHT00901.1 hypothetical protein TRFO_32282 [Tritrichomonas foetus]
MKSGRNNMSALTSSRVRVIAQEAIDSYNRPMTAHEIEKYIKLNDKDLWREVRSKCYDYVRMILSVAKLSEIIKYKCLKRLIGVDKRANFYGLSNKTYDPNVWVPLGKPSEPEMEEPEKDTKFQGAPREITFHSVTEEEAVESWKIMHQNMKVNDPVWNALPSAMKEAHDYAKMGFDSKDIIQYAINKYTPLQDPMVLNDAIVILSRVLIESQEA